MKNLKGLSKDGRRAKLAENIHSSLFYKDLSNGTIFCQIYLDGLDSTFIDYF